MNQALLNKAKALAGRGYQIQVQREIDEDGRPLWVAYVPEMPSCMAVGDSAAKAKEELKIVREDYIYFRLKRGVEVPEPRRMSRDAAIKTDANDKRRRSSSASPSHAVGIRARTIQTDALTRRPAAALPDQPQNSARALT